MNGQKAHNVNTFQFTFRILKINLFDETLFLLTFINLINNNINAIPRLS